MKLCESCNRPVDYSVCVVVSTNRLSPRFQKCSKSIPFCMGCLDAFLKDGDLEIAESIRESIKPAFNELVHHIETSFRSQKQPQQECYSALVKEDGNAA